MKVNPGAMRYVLTFQRNLATRNASGGFTQGAGFVPEDVCSIRGAIQPLSGSENFGDWTASITGYKVTIHWRSDLTEEMRIVFGTRVFQIREIPIVAKSEQFLEIGCEEVKA